MLQSLRSCTALGLLSLSLAAGTASAQAGSPGRDAAQTNSKNTVEGTTTDSSPSKSSGKIKPQTNPSNTRSVHDGAHPTDTATGATKGSKVDCPPAGSGGTRSAECMEGTTGTMSDPTAPSATPPTSPSSTPGGKR